MKDCIKEHPLWRVEKFKGCRDYAESLGRTPDEVVEFEGNLLLNEGIGALLLLLTGGSETAYDNSNAQLGVGTSATAASATQTDLQTGGVWAGMESGFPSISAQTVSFKSSFGTSVANQSWQEFSVRNGATADKNLNRKVQDLGTKSSGDTWVLTLEITFS